MDLLVSFWLVVIMWVAFSYIVPIYAAIRAFKIGENGWGIGCLVAMFVPFGFIVSLAFLIGRDRTYRDAT